MNILAPTLQTKERIGSNNFSTIIKKAPLVKTNGASKSRNKNYLNKINYLETVNVDFAATVCTFP